MLGHIEALGVRRPDHGGVEADALAYLDFLGAHRGRIRTNNVQERCSREIERRTRVVQGFPSEASFIRLVGAVLCDVDDDRASGSFIAPESVAEPWEPSRAEASPAPDPDDGEIEMQGSRPVAIAELDDLKRAA